jgi:hypothetical protein
MTMLVLNFMTRFAQRQNKMKGRHEATVIRQLGYKDAEQAGAQLGFCG